jgi:hypothetical protein
MEKHPSRKKSRFAAAAAALGLAVALTACGTEADSDDPPPVLPEEETETGNETDETVELSVTSPTEGETVTLPFQVTADAGVELGAMADQLHHMHVWFDDGDFLVFESDTAQIEEAPDGETTLWVQVHTYDHAPASEPVGVPLTVEGGNGTGGEGDGGNRGPGNDY